MKVQALRVRAEKICTATMALDYELVVCKIIGSCLPMHDHLELRACPQIHDAMYKSRHEMGWRLASDGMAAQCWPLRVTSPLQGKSIVIFPTVLYDIMLLSISFFIYNYNYTMIMINK